MSLEEVEAFLIRKAMSRYGNVSEAATRTRPEPIGALPAAGTVQL